jgi:hypothetical protein
MIFQEDWVIKISKTKYMDKNYTIWLIFFLIGIGLGFSYKETWFPYYHGYRYPYYGNSWGYNRWPWNYTKYFYPATY